MQTIHPLLPTDALGNARFAIFMSGSGSNAEKILIQIREQSSDPGFRAVALVTDAPETSRTRELGQQYGLPVVECDIRAFYKARGEARVSIATETGGRIRAEWTNELRTLLAPLDIHFAVFAGFVPLTNITADFPCLNVHPGDLTHLKDGERHLVGLHTVPIERAILEGLDHLRTSVIQALPYTGQGDDMDNGPILGVSDMVSIDLDGADLAELQACANARPDRRPKGGFKDRLEEIAKKNQNLLKEGGDWVVLPQVVFDYARGRFGLSNEGALHYRVGKRWHPIETVVYTTNTKEILFADQGEE